jgi:hypothetical protein
MVTSAVYMQSAEFDEARARLDRDNTLLWRHVPRRLEGEVIRDSLLSVAGQLDLTMYGPGTLDQAMRRRSVYFFIKRSQLIPMMMLFDWPEHLVSIGQRSRTTIAPQALLFMNSLLGRQAAEALAKRVESLDDATAVRRLYALAFGRTPEPDEQKLASGFLEKQTEYFKTAGRKPAEHWARVDLCQALLGMNEFVFLE